MGFIRAFVQIGTLNLLSLLIHFSHLWCRKVEWLGWLNMALCPTVPWQDACWTSWPFSLSHSISIHTRKTDLQCSHTLNLQQIWHPIVFFAINKTYFLLWALLSFPLLTSTSNYFSHIIGWIVIFQQHIFLYTKLPSHKKKVYSVISINEHLKTPRAVFWSSTWSCRLCLELGCFCRDFNIHLDNLQNPLWTAVVCILELLGVNQNTIGPTHYSRQTLDSILTFRLFIENIKYTITSVALHSFIELSQNCQLWFVHPLTSQSGDWVKILLHSK